MCGIIGYIGDKDASSILINGLKQLEYRGYDSLGICLSHDSDFSFLKKKGKVSDIVSEQGINGKFGIAHTRWATHGEPNEINAHPHFDCKKEIAIVHNGIIENYSSLKKILEGEGHVFTSETDSEVLSHLVEKFYKGDLGEAVSNAVKVVEGTFGLLVMNKNNEEIVAVKKGSPLILGIGDGEMFVASDSTPLIEHTKKVVYLDDNELVIIKKKEYIVKNFNGETLGKEISEIKWNVNQIQKKGFKHFMLKEIFEQPESLRNFLRGRIKDNEIKLTLDFDVKDIKRIFLVACGTSWHSSLIGKYLIENIANIPVEVDYSSEFRYRNPLLNENDLVIAISQSGETADTLAALREAKSRGAKTMGIVNVVGSTISREVNSGIYLHAGPEIGVASTKAFTSQVLSLLIFAMFLRNKKGMNLDKELIKEVLELPSKINSILSESEIIKNIALDFKSSKNFLYLGRGINFPVALEGALKLKEISYIHAEGYPAAEMKHGPIALIDKEMPILFIATGDVIFDKVLSNIEEVKSREGKIIILTDRDDENLTRLSDYIIKVPKTMEETSPIINSIPLQLLAYYVSDMNGLDVDKPRNLAKSVTVE